MFFQALLLTSGLLSAHAAVVQTAEPAATTSLAADGSGTARPTAHGLKVRAEEEESSSWTSVTTVTGDVVVGGTTYAQPAMYTIMVDQYKKASDSEGLSSYTQFNQPYSSDNPPKADTTAQGDDDEDESNTAAGGGGTYSICVQTSSGVCDSWSATASDKAAAEPTGSGQDSQRGEDTADSSNDGASSTTTTTTSEHPQETTNAATSNGGDTTGETGGDGLCAVYSTATTDGTVNVYGNRGACPTSAA